MSDCHIVTVRSVLCFQPGCASPCSCERSAAKHNGGDPGEGSLLPLPLPNPHKTRHLSVTESSHLHLKALYWASTSGQGTGPGTEIYPSWNVYHDAKLQQLWNDRSWRLLAAGHLLPFSLLLPTLQNCLLIYSTLSSHPDKAFSWVVQIERAKLTDL